MIPICVGYDRREAVAYHTFCDSVIQHCSRPRDLAFIPVTGTQHDGTNSFTYARFEPFVDPCQPFTHAVFADGDMTCLGDIAELWDLFDVRFAVQVVKHEYETKFPRKYWGQANPDYWRKNWTSLMLMNLAHPIHARYARSIRDAIRNGQGAYLHRLSWIPDELIGELPMAWNWLAKEYAYRADAKIVHHTIGLPLDPAGAGDPWRSAWNESFLAAMRYKP